MSAPKPMRRSNFIRRVWHPLLEAAKLPRVKFHSLRHSHVTTLLAEGAPLAAVSERVGHSRASMTTDVYSHTVAGMQRELANRRIASTDRAPRGCFAAASRENRCWVDRLDPTPHRQCGPGSARYSRQLPRVTAPRPYMAPAPLALDACVTAHAAGFA